MRIAMAQMQMQVDIASNLAKTSDYITEALSEGADLLLFPEVQLTPFFAQFPAAEFMQMGLAADSFAVDAGGREVETICRMVHDAGLWCSPNLYVREPDGRCFDRSYMIDPDGNIVGTSEMVNIYSAPKFWEQDYYTPSETGFRVYDTPLGRIGIVICFDRHLAESVRACALQGAELVLIPTANLTGEPLGMFEAEVRAEAFQNNVYIAMCNRVGREGDSEFAGQSLVIGPDGDVLAKADGSEQLLIADIDLMQTDISRDGRNYIQFADADTVLTPLVQRVYQAAAEYDAGDPKRIQHFTKVWTYARLIGLGEKLNARTQITLECAAILHDIGIHQSEEIYGDSTGKHQEELGPDVAEVILRRLDFPEDMIERIRFLIGHHHTYQFILGDDYRILVEADFLVNLYEDGASMEAVRNAYERIFRTETGKRMMREMYGLPA